MQEHWEQSLITLQLANTGLDSFLGKNLDIYVGFILLRLDVISYMSARDLMDIGIWEEIWLVTSIYSMN